MLIFYNVSFVILQQHIQFLGAQRNSYNDQHSYPHQPWCFFFKTITSYQETLRCVLTLCEYVKIIIKNDKTLRSIRQWRIMPDCYIAIYFSMQPMEILVELSPGSALLIVNK